MVGKRPLDKGGKGGGTGVFGRGSEGGGVSWEGAGRVWEERIRGRKASGVGGRQTGASGAAEGRVFALGGMVARQTAPGCTRCVRTEKGRARTKRARAEPPRTGVYVISAWNVRRTGRTAFNRAQGSFFADEVTTCTQVKEQRFLREDKSWLEPEWLSS